MKKRKEHTKNEMSREKVSEGIMVKKKSKFDQNYKPTDTCSSTNPAKETRRKLYQDTIYQLLKISDKEKFLKAARKTRHLTYK